MAVPLTEAERMVDQAATEAARRYREFVESLNRLTWGEIWDRPKHRVPAPARPTEEE